MGYSERCGGRRGRGKGSHVGQGAQRGVEATHLHVDDAQPAAASAKPPA